MGVEDGTEQSQQQIDPAIFRARRKMEALDLPGNIGEILCSDSEKDANERGTRLGAMGGAEQLVTYAMSRIYKVDEGVRVAAEAALAPMITDWGLPENFIEWYLTFGEGAPERMDFDYGEESPSPIKIDSSKQKTFRDAAREFSFKAVREYLLRE